MIHCGTIKLLDSNCDLLCTRVYRNLNHRKTIVDYWRKLYGKRFNKLAIQISPFVPLKFPANDIANTPYYGNVRAAALIRWHKNTNNVESNNNSTIS